MATYQTTNRTSYGRFTIEVTENSYSIANNTSTSSVTLKYTSSQQYYCGISAFTVTDVMGNQLLSYSRSYGAVTNISQGTQTLKSGTVTASHTSTGTGALTIYIKYRIGNATWYEETFTFTNSTIPRASALSLSTTNLSITRSSTAGITATITPKASGFYHILTYALATSGTSGTLANKVQLNNTSANNYSLTRATILTKMPSTASDTITFTLKTYSDSACTAQVGDAQTLRATVTLNSTMAPTVTRVTDATISTYKISGVLIADGYDKVTAVFKTTVQGGPSSCTTYFTTTYGTLATTSTTTTGSNVSVVSNALPLSSTASGNYVITAYAVDSRGLRSSNVTTTAKTINPYSPPVPTITAYRVNSSSSTTADPAGEYLYYKLTGTKANITGNNFNTSTTYSYIQAGSNAKVAYNTAAWVALAAASNITVTAKLTDTISSSNVVSVTVGPAAFPLDLYDNGAGAVGAAIGGVAEAYYFKSYLTSIFNNHANFYGQVRGGDYSKTVFANISPDDVTTKAGGTAPTTTQDYLKYLLKCICDKYTGYTNTVFRGWGSRASNFYYEVFIYSTSNKSTDGLPVYSMGHATQYSGAFNSDFGTNTSSGTTTFWSNPQVGYNTTGMGYLRNYQWAVGASATTEDTILWVGNHNTTTIHEGGCNVRLSNKKAQPIFTLSSAGIWGLFDNTPTNTTNGTTNDYVYLIGKDESNKLPFANIRKTTAYTDANDILPPEGSYYNGSMTMGRLGSSGANNPLSGYTQTILAYRYDTTDCFQLAFPISAYSMVYMRTYRNGTWQPWYRVGGISTSTSAVTVGTATGATLTTQNMRQDGQTVSLYLKFTGNGTAVSARSNFWTGTLASAYRPPYDITTVAYRGGYPCGLTITSAGAITVINAHTGSQTASTSSTFSFGITYVI